MLHTVMVEEGSKREVGWERPFKDRCEQVSKTACYGVD